MTASTKLLAACFAVRVANAVLVQTFFNPDEYWQSLEVAHRIVFGYGHLTWEWAAGLRGYLHPLLFAAPFKVLQLLSLDSRASLLLSAKLLQAACAAVGDVYVYRLSRALFGEPAARWTLACQLASWFNLYCLPRTYANCAEAVCTTVALYYWLPRGSVQPAGARQRQPAAAAGTSCHSHTGQSAQPASLAVSSAEAAADQGGKGDRGTRRGQGQQRRQRLAMAVAALGVLLRPPSALLWLPLGLLELATCRDPLRFLAAEVAPVAASSLALGVAVDHFFYGRWVLVPWEFLRFNLLAGGSARYGGHPWHWNATQGLPTVLTILAPLVALGVYQARRQRALAWLALWSAAGYSLPAHKEFRFLLPALHLLLPYAGAALARLHQLSSCPPAEPQAAPALQDQAPSAAAVAAAGAQDEASAADWLVEHAAGSGAAGSAAGSGLRARQRGRSMQTTAQPAANPGSGRPGHRRRWRVAAFWGGVAVLLSSQLGMAAYFCLVHQRGAVAVMDHLAAEADRVPAMSVLFLMPCHSTPLYSHLHRNISLDFLDCSPPGWHAAVTCLNRQCGTQLGRCAPDRPGGTALTEVEAFRKDPVAFAGARLAHLEARGRAATHVVAFSNVPPEVARLLRKRGYALQVQFFHSHFAVDEAGKQDFVLVYNKM